MKNSNEDRSFLPEVGKEYYFYDDGKVSISRQYKVRITDIIPFSEAKNRVYCVTGKDIINQLNRYNFEAPTYDKIWKKSKIDYPWIFTKDTDYIVIARYVGDNPAWFIYENYDMLFGQSGCGWYTFDDYYNGRLDVDGSLTEQIKNYEKTN